MYNDTGVDENTASYDTQSCEYCTFTVFGKEIIRICRGDEFPRSLECCHKYNKNNKKQNVPDRPMLWMCTQEIHNDFRKLI